MIRVPGSAPGSAPGRSNHPCRSRALPTVWSGAPAPGAPWSALGRVPLGVPLEHEPGLWRIWTGSRDAPEAAGTALVFQGHALRDEIECAPASGSRERRETAPGALQGAPGALQAAPGRSRRAPVRERRSRPGTRRERGAPGPLPSRSRSAPGAGTGLQLSGAPLHTVGTATWSSDRETGRALPDDGSRPGAAAGSGDYLAELLAKGPQLLL